MKTTKFARIFNLYKSYIIINIVVQKVKQLFIQHRFENNCLTVEFYGAKYQRFPFPRKQFVLCRERCFLFHTLVAEISLATSWSPDKFQKKGKKSLALRFYARNVGNWEEGSIIDYRFARWVKKGSKRLGYPCQERRENVSQVLRSSPIVPQTHYTSGAPVGKRRPLSF